MMKSRVLEKIMRVTYNDDKTVAYFDGFKFRRDAKTGYFLSTKVTNQG